MHAATSAGVRCAARRLLAAAHNPYVHNAVVPHQLQHSHVVLKQARLLKHATVWH
jgi:hypothetical protein